MCDKHLLHRTRHIFISPFRRHGQRRGIAFLSRASNFISQLLFNKSNERERDRAGTAFRGTHGVVVRLDRRKEKKRNFTLTGSLLGVAIRDLADDDGLTSAFGVDRVDRDVHAGLDRGLESGERESRLVRIGDVVEGPAADEEVRVAVVHLQDEFLRQTAVVSRNASDLHAGVRLIRQAAVAHRERLS